ncbi:hypothetical protein BFG57_07945 [Bacillus solimangrovi]|uniref:YetF C-terminal domain-containing protein n=2 Tax=Bacillus solimangrovi TaxID=1305675 RepID=A0A1E5LK39_9BACI|nr:hypothetical protein BFG57_07945 [Bacillus solimangrovi]
MDSVKVLGRIITLLPFMLLLGLYMGKRSIGELPVFDFLAVMVFAAVIGADIANPEINHIPTVVAMVAIAIIQKGITFLKIKNRKIGKMLTLEPTIVIHKGKLLMENMKKIQYSIDNVLQMLREKDVFYVEDVEIAIVEANGKLSVKLIPMKEFVTRQDLGIHKIAEEYEIPVILDGEIQLDLLKRLNKDENWLRHKLLEKNIVDVTTVFYCSISGNEKLHISLKENQQSELPPITH